MSDLISRQAAIKGIMERKNAAREWYEDAKVKEDEEIMVRADATLTSFIECILFLKSIPSAQEWIPVKYRPMTAEERKRFEEEYIYGYELEDDEALMFDCEMPEDGQEILVSCRYGRVDEDICQYDGEFYGLEGNDDWDGIIAWMPLPEPYREEKE